MTELELRSHSYIGSFSTELPLINTSNDHCVHVNVIYLFAGKQRKADIGDFLRKAERQRRIKLTLKEFDIERNKNQDLTTLPVLKEKYGASKLRVASMAAISKSDGGVRPLHDGDSIRLELLRSLRPLIGGHGGRLARRECSLENGSIYISGSGSKHLRWGFASSFVGFHLRYDLCQVGITDTRGEWLCNWIDNIAGEGSWWPLVTSLNSWVVSVLSPSFSLG